MRPRALADLTQLGDEELFAELARGMRLSLTNALRLWRDAGRLATAGRPQGFRILAFLVEEEAAKFHILLDAARCPRNPQDIFSRQLRYFSQHLARGLYAMCYEWQLMDLAETRHHIDRERQTLYLDGPNDNDWIFRNDIERRREEAMYVDYVAYRDAYRDQHQWHCPNPQLLRMHLPPIRPAILRAADTLHHIGVTGPEAVRAVAEIWRHEQITGAFTRQQVHATNIRTIEHLRQQGLLRPQPQARYDSLVHNWIAPLFPLDLGPLEVAPDALRDA